MDIILFIIILLAVADLLLYSFNYSIRGLRRKENKNLIIFGEDKDDLRRRAEELTKQLEKFKSENVNLKDYNELSHRYNLLLDQNRRLLTKNNYLEARINHSLEGLKRNL